MSASPPKFLSYSHFTPALGSYSLQESADLQQNFSRRLRTPRRREIELSETRDAEYEFSKTVNLVSANVRTKPEFNDGLLRQLSDQEEQKLTEDDRDMIDTLYTYQIWDMAALYVCWIVLILLGALMFMYIESPHEKDLINEREQLKVQIEQKYNIHNWTEFEADILHFADLPSSSNWNFSGSIFFTLSIAGTIGWGIIAPATSLGKVIYFFYSLLVICTLNIILSRIFFQQTRISQLYYYKHGSQNEFIRKHFQILHVVFILVLIFIIWSLLALVMQSIEEWTYLDSMDFVWQCFTTCGFGNITPAISEYSGFEVGITVAILGIPLLIGISLLPQVIVVLYTSQHTRLAKLDRLKEDILKSRMVHKASILQHDSFIECIGKSGFSVVDDFDTASEMHFPPSLDARRRFAMDQLTLSDVYDGFGEPTPHIKPQLLNMEQVIE